VKLNLLLLPVISSCGRKTFCPNEDDSCDALFCISDIIIVRHNIRLTLMG
jgi:hypothetical protein